MFLCLLIYCSKAFEPHTPQDQLKEFAANLMHYEFGDGYEVVNTKSQNNHPDRPQDLVIKLTDDEFAKLKAYIETLEDGEERNHLFRYDNQT